MNRFCIYLLSGLMLLVAASCESDSGLKERSNISVVGLGQTYTGIGKGDDTIFSGDEILWLNEKTREIRFREDFRAMRLPQYGTLLFKLAGMELFTARVVSRPDAPTVEDMVLFHDPVSDKYYLHDSHPDQLNTEQVRLNAEIRAENWALFLIQMRREGRLK